MKTAGVIGLMLLTTLMAFVKEGKPAALNARQARPSPEWMTRGVMYQIWLRAFTPEGTLKAAAARLPKLARLGADIIYLCPVYLQDDDLRREFWSPRQIASGMNNPRNPYRIKDYFSIDPEYGTEAELKSFVATAHRLGQRVILDVVYLHCGPTAVFLKAHPDFVKRDGEGKIINGEWKFPALNYDNPELREYLCKNLEFLVNTLNVDGFRCDASDHIPLDFWETARHRLEKIRPDLVMLAEGSRREDQLDAFNLDYGWTFVGKDRNLNDAATVRTTWEKMRGERPRGGARFIRFIDNHDIANDADGNRIEKAWGARRVNAALAVLFTIDGVPFLYNGQEIVDTARHSIYGRLPIDWANGDTTEGKARYALCRKLCALRHAERALTDGEVTWLDNSAPQGVLSYLRTLGNQRILTVVNVTGRPVKVRMARLSENPSEFRALLAEGSKEDGKGMFELYGYGFFLGKK